jgi:hypothetical protein
LKIWPGSNLIGSRDNEKIKASERLIYLIFPHILSLDQGNQKNQDSNPLDLLKLILVRVVYSLRNDR